MEQVLFKNRKPERPLTFQEYCEQGGYEALKKAMNMAPEEIVTVVKDSSLKGRGGAGFPTGVKWTFLPKEIGDRYIIANCDEMEPGTYKDRILLEANPHILIEGILITAFALSVKESFIFIRRAYSYAASLLEKAIEEARLKGFLGKNILGTSFSTEIKVHLSAGRYICGEETALINALEGIRPNPRARPPYPAAKGLWQQPTVVNNVETLSNIPGIVMNGSDWFKDLAATPEGAGTKLFCVSGRVNRSECFELPIGIPLRELVETHCQGMKNGTKFKACIPGGTSTPYMAAEHLDVPLDFDAVEKAGSRLGTGAVIVFDENDCLVDATWNLMKFFARESCGWCTPCRNGLPYIKHLLSKIEMGQGKMDDVEILREHVHYLEYAFCAFAPGAIGPLEGLLRLFEKEIKDHIHQGRCPFKKNA